MADLKLLKIEKTYPGGITAVKDFNLEIEDKEFIVLVGPSGCGKSTALRMIAGLEAITRGELLIDGRRMNEVKPKDRDIAMVFQNYALYPHMSVYDNMAFGLKLKKVPKEEINRRVLDAAKTLDIADLLGRKPKALSGGQKQRVAMGRAIVRNPKVFLMDEPLSNLDAKLRVKMRAEIAKLYRQLQTTFIYVTHDQTEAMTLGSRIVVMKDGVIQQVGAPYHLYQNPANLFVASFIGSPPMNLLEAKLEKDGGLAFLTAEGMRIKLPESKAQILLKRGYEGREVVWGIRPEELYPLAENPPWPLTEAVLEGTVVFTEILGAEILLHTMIAGQELTARVSGEPNLVFPGRIRLAFNPERLHFFDPTSKLAIVH